MQFDIRSADMPGTAAWAENIRRRLRFGLTRHGDSIRNVKVRMSRPAGADMVCCVTILFVDSEPAEVREAGPDPDAVIGRAADRVSRMAILRLERARINASATRHVLVVPPGQSATRTPQTGRP